MVLRFLFFVYVVFVLMVLGFVCQAMLDLQTMVTRFCGFGVVWFLSVIPNLFSGSVGVFVSRGFFPSSRTCFWDLSGFLCRVVFDFFMHNNPIT